MSDQRKYCRLSKASIKIRKPENLEMLGTGDVYPLFSEMKTAKNTTPYLLLY